MKNLIFSFLVLASASNSFASDSYPDARRDRPSILRAAELNGITLNNLEFPLSKQLVTAPLTTLLKIPELVGYVFGSNEGFATLHTVTFEQEGINKTCGAIVILKPDDSVFVGVSNCGTNHVNYNGKGEVIPLTRVK